jgi:oxygen-independent coproporphyrinogen-3 oxidase
MNLPSMEDYLKLKKYEANVPRYTSYPTAAQFIPFESPDFFWENLGKSPSVPLSLYCHIPFCEKACYFCGCNTVITTRKEAATQYLEALIQNIEQWGSRVPSHRPATQLHWGGGTPNFLNPSQMEELFSRLKSSFNLTPDAEISIEINPSYIQKETLFLLRHLGFNRISFGIQDFDPLVQQSVNRVQPEPLLFEVMGWIREAGFESVNVDLIYGLPNQNPTSFAQTIQKTIRLNPDRIAVFHFAYVPWMKPLQLKLPKSALPTTDQKLEMAFRTEVLLNQAGYVTIGMDHFAKATDELAKAQASKKLYRNFQGYTTQKHTELLGMGTSAISQLDLFYMQLSKNITDYTKKIQNHEIPGDKMCVLTPEDATRRAIIMELMCQFEVNATLLLQNHNLKLEKPLSLAFSEAYSYLKPLSDDGYVTLDSDGIVVSSKGRLLVRNIASAFDGYFNPHSSERFSKSI